MGDPLVMTMRAAQAHHAALLRGGDQRAICEAYITALEAERALLLDCGGADDLVAAEDLALQIVDQRGALAQMS